MVDDFHDQTRFEIPAKNFFPQINSLGWTVAMQHKLPVHERLNDRNHYLSLILEVGDKCHGNVPCWDIIAEAHLPDTNRSEQHVIRNMSNFPAKQIMLAMGESYDRQRNYYNGNGMTTVVPEEIYDEMAIYQRNGSLPYIVTTLEMMLPADLELSEETAVKKTQDYFASLETNKSYITKKLAENKTQGVDKKIVDMLMNAHFCTQFYAIAVPTHEIPENYALFANSALNSRVFMMYCDDFHSTQKVMEILEGAYLRPTIDNDPQAMETKNNYTMYYKNWGPGNPAHQQLIACN